MDLPAYQTLKTGLSERILTVTLNRPEAMNALNSQMGLDLIDMWKRLEAQHDDVRVVILTGSGDRAFCAGGDLKERNGMSDEAWREQHEIFEHRQRRHEAEMLMHEGDAMRAKRRDADRQRDGPTVDLDRR